MSARHKKEAPKHFLATTVRRHLREGEPEIARHQIHRQQDGWNYSDFVAYLLEIIVVLRLRDK
jgi:hypothetical protein